MTNSRHLFTGSCTFSTHFGAFSTMLHAHSSVLFALFRTTVTGICANTAELFTEASAHTHHLNGCSTYSGTFQVKLDARPQRLYMLFIQAGHSTMVAFSSTCLAGFNTFLIVLV
jgi:hypothetical protein